MGGADQVTICVTFYRMQTLDLDVLSGGWLASCILGLFIVKRWEVAADVFENIKNVGCVRAVTSVIGILM